MWGLLYQNSYLLNAHNRHWLLWHDYVDLNFTDSIDVVVSDFITTGNAYRLEIPGSSNSEAFFIENHQSISIFDDYVNRDGEEKGLYIYHVKGTGNKPSIDVESAEGNFNWENLYWIQNPWNPNNLLDSIPVFQQGIPDVYDYDGRDALPTTKSVRHKVFVTDNNNDGNWEVDRRVFGSPFDAFDVSGNNVFSRWSNPNNRRWLSLFPGGISIEILSKFISDISTGAESYNIRIRKVSHENAVPSRPQILSLQHYDDGINTGIEVNWMANLEPDILGYEVYRGSGDGTNISKVSGTNLVTGTSWVNFGLEISEQSNWQFTYFVKAVDESNKVSNLSLGLTTGAEYVNQNSNKVIFWENMEQEIQNYKLYNNYPNPFNQRTVVSFDLPREDQVNLSIFDVSGQLIRVLLVGAQKPGHYQIIWDGRNVHEMPVASGVYIYRLQTASNTIGKKITLIR